ncbi:MAG: BREX-3 system P-loop-containing protein BrxF [Chromatiaceae bacterium]|nr:BREX-3 system P-loop-containing protein BrxF [Chromatiaceae bacterium]
MLSPAQAVEQLAAAIRTAEALYHRLVLLVGTPGSGKTLALRRLADQEGCPLVNVNLALSAALLDLSPRQRTLHLPRLLDDVTASSGSLRLLDNLEILFDPDLRQDPLRLLQQLARRHRVVASWGGILTSSTFTYAVNGHPEHRVYDAHDLLIVNLNTNPTDPHIKSLQP